MLKERACSFMSKSNKFILRHNMENCKFLILLTLCAGNQYCSLSIELAKANTSIHCERSEAPVLLRGGATDCFVAVLLAMTDCEVCVLRNVSYWYNFEVLLKNWVLPLLRPAQKHLKIPAMDKISYGCILIFLAVLVFFFPSGTPSGCVFPA